MTDDQDPLMQKAIATGAYHIAVRDYFVSIGPDKWFRESTVRAEAMKLFHAEGLHSWFPEPDHILDYYFARVGPQWFVESHPVERSCYRLGAAGRELIERWASESAAAKAAFRREHPGSASS